MLQSSGIWKFLSDINDRRGGGKFPSNSILFNKIWKFQILHKKRIPTNTGGASSPPSSFQNFTFRKKISALPFGTSPRSALM